MLSWIVYGVGASVAGLVLGFLWMTIFGHPSKVDRSVGSPLLKGLLVGLAGPFLWSEGLTKAFGPALEPAAKKAFIGSPIKGQMRYFRIVSYTNRRAKLYAFGEEKDRSGFTDRPVISVTLAKREGEWAIEETEVIACDRLNKDGLVLPPYQ